MGLLILRAAFILITSGLGIVLINSGLVGGSNMPERAPEFFFIGMLALAILIIIVDILIPRKRLEIISSLYFGLLVGFFISYMINIGLTPLYNSISRNSAVVENIQSSAHLILTVIMSYISVSLLMQTRKDFRFIIPYVEFSRDVKSQRPYILDTSVVIDGRIADVVTTTLFDCQIIMPQFIITELQQIADSSDKIRRARGQRGLDILNQLRRNPDVDLQIFTRRLPEFKGQDTDMCLVLLATHLAGKLITNDYNLNKVARLNGVPVLNINDLANTLKPIFIPGECLDIRVIKAGESPAQGVGYLSDGTMVVIEDGRNRIGEQVSVLVTSVLQTSAGRMIFGKIEPALKADRDNPV